MNFIVNLSLSLHKKNACDAILIVVNKYIKMTRYIFTFMKIKVAELTDLLYEEIYLKYDAS